MVLVVIMELSFFPVGACLHFLSQLFSNSASLVSPHQSA